MDAWDNMEDIKSIWALALNMYITAYTSSHFAHLVLCPARDTHWWLDSIDVWHWGFAARGSGHCWARAVPSEWKPLVWRGTSFTVTAACRGPLRTGHVVLAVTPPVSFHPERRPKTQSQKSNVCLRNWEAGGIDSSPFSVSAAQLNKSLERYVKCSRVKHKETQRAARRPVWQGAPFVIRCPPALSLSLLMRTLHTLFNGPFLRQTNRTKTFLT